MSAGQFFDLIRPVFLIVSAFLSAWILFNARRNGFRLHSSLAWSLASLFLPLVVFPLYLFVRINRQSKARDDAARTLHGKFLLPGVYLGLVLAIFAAAQYRERRNVDTYLARATQARVAGNTANAIEQYRKALLIEDNPHTHKLLAVQLNIAGDLNGALSEFRLAEKGGEPDPTLPFRIAALLDLLNSQNEAVAEYERFLRSESCTKQPSDDRCVMARQRIDEIRRVRPDK